MALSEYNRQRAVSLSPAKWIWVNSGRTLPSTFADFTRSFAVKGPVRKAQCAILGDSRYLLKVNGKRCQWGNAPADPRYEEVDLVDIAPFLVPGGNRLDITVCYYAYGDGTWVTGLPGLIYRLEVEYEDGSTQLVVSDRNTLSGFQSAHPAGTYKRWYLRALQEQYDARKADDVIFAPSMELRGAPDKPSLCDGYRDYLFDTDPKDISSYCLRSREIPFPAETKHTGTLTDTGTVTWHRDPDDWFRFRIPDSFTLHRIPTVTDYGPDQEFTLPENGDAVYLTYAMDEQMAGFIDFTITAPEGTTIEAMIQESHDADKTPWLDSHFFSWTRFITAEGENHFTSFDYECAKYLQLHVRGRAGAKIRIENAGFLRRTCPLPDPGLHVSDPEMEKLLQADLNTLRNSIIETCCDGMGRERQQYSGDCNHQVYAFSSLYGADHPIVHRFLETYSDGMVKDGFYFDSWPASDRMQRLGQYQLGLSQWAPILDHTVEFIYGIWDNYMQTGKTDLAFKCIDDFERFYEFLLHNIREDGLIDNLHLTGGYVWMDHNAYRKERDKKCSFNLYVAGVLKKALAPLLELTGRSERAAEVIRTADSMISALNELYCDAAAGIYVDNLPWAGEDGERRVSDRTLAMSVLYDICPDREAALDVMEGRCAAPAGDAADGAAQSGDGRAATDSTGTASPILLLRSYPANALWMYDALAERGRPGLICDELRSRFAVMDSVRENNTLQEFFHITKDTTDEMSHCAAAPLMAFCRMFTGLRVTEPGFKSFTVSPDFGSCSGMDIDIPVKTVSGTIVFRVRKGILTIDVPEGITGRIRRNGTEEKIVTGREYAL